MPRAETLGHEATAKAETEHSACEPQQHSPVFRHGAGLIAGLYQREELTIDLRQLCEQAGVAFVEAEITDWTLTKNL